MDEKWAGAVSGTGSSRDGGIVSARDASFLSERKVLDGIVLDHGGAGGFVAAGGKVAEGVDSFDGGIV